jgi:hypothetical protein
MVTGAGAVWAGQEGDPSSRKALLWMTANYGLGERTRGLGEADRIGRREGLYVGLSNRFAHAGFAIGGASGGMLPLETDSSEES